MVAVIAKLKIKEGMMDEAKRIFEDFFPNVKGESGTLSYTLNKDRSDPDLLVVLERYEDEASLKSHSSQPYFAEFSSKIGKCLAGPPEIVVLDEILSI